MILRINSVVWGGTIYFLFPKKGGMLNIEVKPYYFFIYKLYLGVCPKSLTVGGGGGGWGEGAIHVTSCTSTPPPCIICTVILHM